MDNFTDKNGNTIERNFVNGDGEMDRYYFDFQACKPSDGWHQYDTDQDASYFGVWYHPERRQIVTYAEGDLTRVTCPTEESYRAELNAMAEFYGDPPPAFVSYQEDDNGHLVRTEHYDANARP